MLKALTGLVIAGAAALAIASPAAAAPVCQDGEADAYGYHGSYAAASVSAYNYCTGENLEITAVGGWPSYYVTYYPYYGEVYIDGLYYSYEDVEITVSDGDGYDTFTLRINPHFTYW